MKIKASKYILKETKTREFVANKSTWKKAQKGVLQEEKKLKNKDIGNKYHRKNKYVVTFYKSLLYKTIITSHNNMKDERRQIKLRMLLGHYAVREVIKVLILWVQRCIAWCNI